MIELNYVDRSDLAEARRKLAAAAWGPFESRAYRFIRATLTKLIDAHDRELLAREPNVYTHRWLREVRAADKHRMQTDIRYGGVATSYGAEYRPHPAREWPDLTTVSLTERQPAVCPSCARRGRVACAHRLDQWDDRHADASEADKHDSYIQAIEG